jgi:predicted AAA+ superfamily ATPase
MDINGKLIKRTLLGELKEHLEQKEVSLIVGPRQVGKTTLMLLLEKKLKQRGGETLYLNLDRETDRRHFVSQENLISKIRLEIGHQRGFVFIDEIQRKEDAGLFLKGIYDSNLPYKFIVSGSGSLELKEKIHESLTGRKKVFKLNPVSFEEFANFKTDYRYEGRLKEFFEVEVERRETLLWEYLNYGGYPRIITAERDREKREIVDEIFHSYLEKDISYLLQVERVDAFSNLVRILASQLGQLVSYSRIASEINLSIKTLKNYLWYAEKTFVLQKLTPYFKNVRKEIVKAPAYYFYDLGLRNYSIGKFGNLIEFGPIFENFILNIIQDEMRWSGATIHFWRTKDKAEVDFIINSGEEILPIEVKYKKMIKPSVERSMKSFIERYSPPRATVVNLSLKDKVQIGRTEILFLPFWEMLFDTT